LAFRQASEGWGAAVIPRLALDLRNELPEVKGFSERNLKRMLTFYRAYPDLGAIVPPAVAPIPASLLRSVPWAHHIILIEKVKDLPIRRWYMQAILEQGWTRDGLMMEIQANAQQRQGRVANNFDVRLPAPQSDLVKQTLKDPYLFDFLTLEEPFHERELETGLVQHVERFLLELGRGFAFLGRQYPLSVAGQDFYPDLLLYHVRLHCYLVVELKRGEFKPEYAGKMNFYLNIVDDQLRQPPDGPTIGLILCQVHNRVLAEYALRGIEKPIGVSAFELTRALPASLQSALPSFEQIEQGLAGHGEEPKNPEDSQAGD
jgi:predicted nuclease of restriction endonuclease-like (RecB) superfamily